MELKIPVAGEIELHDLPDVVFNVLPFYRYNKKGVLITSVYAENGIFHVPRNIKKIASILKKVGVAAKFVDNRIKVPVSTPIILNEGFALKPDQIRCTGLIKGHHTRGNTSMILEAPCGWGKTFQLAYYLFLLQQKTLILVDRTDLVNQMVEEIEANTNIKMTILSAKNTEVGDVNIATLQFMMKNSKLLDDVASKVGSVILDECHIAPATKFCKVIGRLPALYRLGLSATPTRSDGLTQIIYDVFSNTKVVGKNDGLSCTIVKLYREESFQFPAIRVYKQYLDAFLMQKSLTVDISYLLKALVEKGRLSMLYTTSQVVQEYYYKVLTDLGLRCVVVNAHTKKRKDIFLALDRKEYDVLIAGTVLNKGVSIKRLDTCISLASLTKEDIEQLIGRLRRDHPEKRPPILIDFYFDEGRLWRKALVRDDTYRTLREKYSDKVISRRNFESLKKSLKIKEN